MYRAYVAMSLLVIASTAVAQPNALTEEMAVQIGLSRDPVLQRTEGTITQAQSDVIAAKTWPNPEFQYERETLENGVDIVEQKFVLSQRFDVSGRRGLRKQAAGHHLNAARFESDAWRAELTKEIRQRYYSSLRQQMRRQVYKTMQARIRVLSNALQKRRQEGDVSIYDYQRVKTARAAIDAEVRNVEVDYQSEWQSLWALLGTGTQNFQSLEGQLSHDQIRPLDELIASLNHQPALRQLREQTDGFTLQQRAESRTFPDVTLGLGVKQEEIADQTFDGLVINASLPIPIFDRRKDKQTRYQAEALITQSRYQLALTKASAEVKGLWMQSTQYQRSAEMFREDAIQGTQDLMKTAEVYYRAGEIGILGLLDAYRGALNAELNALDLEFKARTAQIKLDYLTGGTVQ